MLKSITRSSWFIAALLFASNAHASSWNTPPGQELFFGGLVRRFLHRLTGEGGGHAVPELDPGAAGSVIVFVLLGAAFVVSRQRTKNAG